MMIRTALPCAAALAAATLALTGCTSGSADSASAPETTQDGEVSIVASTSIWGDVARAVTDDARVTVTEFIRSDDVDPHHFEPSAADMARASEADIAVVGGGGYDAWLYEPLADKQQAIMVHPLPLDAHEHGHDTDGTSGHDDGRHADDAAHAGLDASENEHVWYDPQAVIDVAHEVAAAINQHNPEITTHPEDVDAKLGSLTETLEDLPPVRVAQTEPIADHLLAHSPAREVTPEGYRRATLHEAEPSAADLAEFLDLVKDGGLDLLIYNPQTATELTERIRAAAENQGLPVFELPETPQGDTNFLDYLQTTVSDLDAVSQKAVKH